MPIQKQISGNGQSEAKNSAQPQNLFKTVRVRLLTLRNVQRRSGRACAATPPQSSPSSAAKGSEYKPLHLRQKGGSEVQRCSCPPVRVAQGVGALAELGKARNRSALTDRTDTAEPAGNLLSRRMQRRIVTYLRVAKEVGSRAVPVLDP